MSSNKLKRTCKATDAFDNDPDPDPDMFDTLAQHGKNLLQRNKELKVTV